MTSLVERLRTTPTERTWDSVGRPYDYPKHLPLEAADRIEALERQVEDTGTLLRNSMDCIRALEQENAGLKKYLGEKSDQYIAACRENAELVTKLMHSEARAILARRKALEDAAILVQAHPMRFAGQAESYVRRSMAEAIRALMDKTP